MASPTNPKDRGGKGGEKKKKAGFLPLQKEDGTHTELLAQLCIPTRPQPHHRAAQEQQHLMEQLPAAPGPSEPQGILRRCTMKTRLPHCPRYSKSVHHRIIEVGETSGIPKSNHPPSPPCPLTATLSPPTATQGWSLRSMWPQHCPPAPALVHTCPHNDTGHVSKQLLQQCAPTQTHTTWG